MTQIQVTAMKKAIYPGTFDPITYGHLDVIRRTARIVDELIVGVLINSSKKPLFTVEERVDMIKKVVADIPNVRVESFDGLQAEYASREGAFLVHGLRTSSDFEYELQISQASRAVYPDVDTMFMAASQEYSYISSSIVRETAKYNGDISRFVPEYVGALVKEKINTNR